MVTLREVREEDRQLLWNLNQKYLYEMTQYYHNEMDEEGNIICGYFERYFTDPERKAFLIESGGIVSGFAFIHPYSLIKGNPDHTMAEFTVFPAYRGKHIGEAAVREIFSMFPGRWEIKYHERNLPAKTFWNRMTEAYHPSHVSYSDQETVLVFNTEQKENQL